MCCEGRLKHISLLLKRLERLSADSIWSHRASGIRGSLIEYMEGIEGSIQKVISDDLENILDQGYYVLEQAAKLSLSSNRIRVKNANIANELGERAPGKNISPE